MNPKLLMPLHPIVLLQVRMQLHLVHTRWVTRVVEQNRHLMRIEIAYTDMFRPAFLEE